MLLHKVDRYQESICNKCNNPKVSDDNSNFKQNPITGVPENNTCKTNDVKKI